MKDRRILTDLFVAQTFVALFVTLHTPVVIRGTGGVLYDFLLGLVMFFLLGVELVLGVYLFHRFAGGKQGC